MLIFLEERHKMIGNTWRRRSNLESGQLPPSSNLLASCFFFFFCLIYIILFPPIFLCRFFRFFLPIFLRRFFSFFLHSFCVAFCVKRADCRGLLVRYSGLLSCRRLATFGEGEGEGEGRANRLGSNRLGLQLRRMT